jgi:hypothetical protein
MMTPEAYVLGLRLTHVQAYSAMPDAPVVPVRARRSGVRRATARAPRRMADRMEPMT